MEEEYVEFQNLNKNNEIQMKISLFNKFLKSFDFLHLNENRIGEIKFQYNEMKAIIIDEHEKVANYKQISQKFFIICISRTVIIINQIKISLLERIFFENQESTIFCLTQNCQRMIKDAFPKMKLNFSMKDETTFIKYEIPHFLQNFSIKNNKGGRFWKVVQKSIAGYLIKKSYFLCNFNRIKNWTKTIKDKREEEFLNKKEIVDLKLMFIGLSKIHLSYLVKYEILCILKTPNSEQNDTKLIERERQNYLRINHPFIPRYYGYIKDFNEEKSLLIEYINGETLNNIVKLNLSYREKILIIFEIFLVFQYLHYNEFIYRDLKPNNVIIDQNKTAVLIDFDRLIINNYENINVNSTRDFNHIYTAPEIFSEKYYSYPVDIYSLGLLIYFIIMEKEYDQECIKLFPYEFSQQQNVFTSCINKEPKNRPTMSELIWNFFFNFIYPMNNMNEIKKNFIEIIEYNVINGKNSKKDNETLRNLGKIYYYKDTYNFIELNITKTIHYFTLAANNNDLLSQKFLKSYYNIKKSYDINKAIYYFTLASNQNDVESQFVLGYIYSNDLLDLNKSIYYYELAAKQNHIDSQLNLANILSNFNLNKAIYYWTLAANQNDSRAQFNLGNTYYNIDLKKAIYYYTLSANNNFVLAQFNLGIIYFDEYNQDEKGIYYLELAAKQNHLSSQMKLGMIYYFGENNVVENLQKSIYFFTLAANQNDAEAQYTLGYIYINKKEVFDINKGLDYLTKAADQNHQKAKGQLGYLYYNNEYFPRNIKKALHYLSNTGNFDILGNIYEKGIAAPRDILKAIYYYKLGADRNDEVAQYNLGRIYLSKSGTLLDKKKGLQYLLLSAKQGYAIALSYLGHIYYNGIYVEKNIEKGIYYYKIGAEKKDHIAQFNLGQIFFAGQKVPRDINKAIYYHTLSANQSNPNAHYILGIIYSEGYTNINIPKAINHYLFASENGIVYAQVNLAIIYHEGKHIKKNIEKAIHYYKEASCFNNQVAKNNLGIIFKFGDGVKTNIGIAFEYFQEAVNQKNDLLAKYNLAHIYFFENNQIEDTLNLIIQLLEYNVYEINIFFYLVLIKKCEFSIEKINEELKKLMTDYPILLSKNQVDLYIYGYKLIEVKTYNKYYNTIKNTNFYYSKTKNGYIMEKYKKECKKIDFRNEIDKNFYDGFGIFKIK